MQVRLGRRHYTLDRRQGWQFVAVSWVASWIVFVGLVMWFCEYDNVRQD